MANTTKAAKLSQTMEEALVYLGRGAYRAHLEPERRTLEALERRGMIVWSTDAELGAVGSYRIHDTTRLWDVTEAGWAFLAAEYDMERPADEGRLTVEEALELVLVDDGAMYDHTEVTARLRSAHRYGSGLLAHPDYDGSGITGFLVKLGLARLDGEGLASSYVLSTAGEEAARKDAAFHNDEDGDVAMDADALAAANFAARRPAAPQERGAVRQSGAATASALLPTAPERCGAMDTGDLDACGHCPDCTGETAAKIRITGSGTVSARPLEAVDAPLKAGDRVVVRRSAFDTWNRTWVPQEPFSAAYLGYHRNGQHMVKEDQYGTTVWALRSEIHPDTRLELDIALDLADLCRRTGLALADCPVPADWPTA
jgi:predicted N-acetyltransferase YhbS